MNPLSGRMDKTMAITENDVFVCDYCGEDTGKFNQETGNHPPCEQVAALRARVEALEKFFNEVEWSGDQNAHVCPDCGNKKSQGHRPSCRYRTLREA